MLELLTYLSPFFILLVFFLCFCRFVFRGCMCGCPDGENMDDMINHGEMQRHRRAACALARVHPALQIGACTLPSTQQNNNAQLPKYEDAIKIGDPPPAYSPPVSAREHGDFIAPPAYAPRRASISATVVFPIVRGVVIPETPPDLPSAVPISARQQQQQQQQQQQPSNTRQHHLTLSVERLADDHVVIPMV